VILVPLTKQLACVKRESTRGQCISIGDGAGCSQGRYQLSWS